MEDPTSLTWLLAAIGLLFVLIGLLGGGVQAKGVQLPSIGTAPRVLSVFLGAVLVVVALFFPPGEPGAEDRVPSQPPTGDPTSPGEEGEEERPPAPEPVDVPALKGRTQDAASKALEAAGLSVGKLTTRSSLAPHGEVLEQSPRPGSRVEPGTSVDLVVADSVLRFLAHRELIDDKGKTSTVEAEYRLEVSRARDSGELVGEFRVTSTRVRPSKDAPPGVLESIREQPGYVSLDALETMDLPLAWPAYAKLEREMETESAKAKSAELKDRTALLSSAIWATLVGSQVSFDVRAMLMPLPEGRDSRDTRLVLQAEQSLLARIEVRGPASAGRESRVLSVFRKEKDKRERKVGTASYDIATGILRKLDLSYQHGEDGSYRLRITRM